MSSVPGPALRLLDDPALAAALAQLHALDPAVIGPLLATTGQPTLRTRAPGFAGLAAIVVGQQLSTASAGAILGRLETAIRPLDVATLARAEETTLRGCGLSVAKIRTLRAVADAVRSGALCFDDLADLEADRAHAALVAVHGIGPWTADVFLLFCLGHADAWPVGDLALQEAARLLFERDRRPSSAELQVLGDRWRPYRGAAAYLLWAYYGVRKGRTGAPVAGEGHALTATSELDQNRHG